MRQHFLAFAFSQRELGSSICISLSIRVAAVAFALAWAQSTFGTIESISDNEQQLQRPEINPQALQTIETIDN